MSVDAGGALAPSRGGQAHVAVIVALGVELQSFRDPKLRWAPSMSLRQCGPGGARAAAAAQAAVAQGAKALVSWGIAGGLAPDAAPGTLLLPKVVVTPDGARFRADEAWHSRLAGALGRQFSVLDRPLLAGGDVLRTPARKAEAAAAHGAAGVDLESGSVAAAAARAGVPFVVVRAIADAATDTLPAGIEDWIDGDGNPRFAAVAGAALKPQYWPALWMLAQRYRTARRTLDAAALALVPEAFSFRQDAPLGV